jgi:hypothetical protein
MKTKISLPFVLLLLALTFTGLDAQDLRKINGVVLSFKTIPLNNVMITAVKADNTVFTDSDGMFSINCYKRDILKISASGFVDKNQKVGKESSIKINLVFVDNIENFNDAVNNGHISQDVLRNVLTAEESENTKDYSKYHNIYDLVASEIYNLRVKGNSIVNTKIRSLDATPEVLLVVNNKIVNDISFVATDDVKSIEFIDDVRATMYGSMGANGVLKITLK